MCDKNFIFILLESPSTKMENKDGDKNPEEVVDDLLDQALEGFEDENKLNLTNNDTEKDGIIFPKNVRVLIIHRGK